MIIWEFDIYLCFFFIPYLTFVRSGPISSFFLFGKANGASRVVLEKKTSEKFVDTLLWLLLAEIVSGSS